MNDPNRYFCAAAMPSGVVGFRAKRVFASEREARAAGQAPLRAAQCTEGPPPIQ